MPVQPAPVPEPAPAAAPAPVSGYAAAPAPPPPPAPAAPAVTFFRAAPTDAIVAEDVGALPTTLVVTGQRAARTAAPHPPAAPARTYTPAEDERARQWLDLMTTLLDRGLDTDARRTWPRFRAEFPDYPVPPALQARIDALQGR